MRSAKVMLVCRRKLSSLCISQISFVKYVFSLSLVLMIDKIIDELNLSPKMRIWEHSYSERTLKKFYGLCVNQNPQSTKRRLKFCHVIRVEYRYL